MKPVRSKVLFINEHSSQSQKSIVQEFYDYKNF